MESISVRQGDVLLCLVSSIPKDAIEEQVTKGNKIILAFGEATGHHHRFENVIDRMGTPIMRLWTAAGERFLQVLVRSALQHEEHSTAYIDPGIYQLPVQVEYTSAELVRVTD